MLPRLRAVYYAFEDAALRRHAAASHATPRDMPRARRSAHAQRAQQRNMPYAACRRHCRRRRRHLPRRSAIALRCHACLFLLPLAAFSCHFDAAAPCQRAIA